MSNSNLKFHILTPFKEGAYGGRVQFLKALRGELEVRSVYTEDYRNADVVIFDSFPFGQVKQLYKKAIDFKNLPGRRIILHRVDGPISVVRGSVRDFYVDDAIRIFNSSISDGTVYQSVWSKSLCEGLGIGTNKPSATIINAPDPGIFFPSSESAHLDRRISIVASSWSSNWRKGFDVYKYLDDHLDFSRYRFSFIGNCPFKFKNAVQIPPLPPHELAKKLRESDVFISASVDDPCSNSVLEAKYCGLRLLLRNSGGHPELLDGRGVLFEGASDVLMALDKCVALHLPNLIYNTISSVADRYIEFSGAVYTSEVERKLDGSVTRKLYESVITQRYKPAFTRAVSRYIPVKESIFYRNAAVLKSVGRKDLAGNLEGWCNKVVDRIPLFLNCMRSPVDTSLYRFSYSSDLRKETYLVASVFAAKIGYIVDCLSGDDKAALARHINSFQTPDGSIYDPWIIFRSIGRRILLSVWSKNFGLMDGEQIRRAETRQSFAALKALGAKPSLAYSNISSERDFIFKYIDGLNWSHPWNSISHFSHLIFFILENANILERKDDALLDDIFDYVFDKYRREDGFWYKEGASVAITQRINGAMKMVTALDCAGVTLTDGQERIIDACLTAVNDGHACNHFNIVCLLHHCMKSSDYKRDQVRSYLLNRLSQYQEYYWDVHGGFSFYKNSANDRFYDARLTTGMCEPDLHGTKMMLWGIKLISEVMGWSVSDRLRNPIT